MSNTAKKIFLGICIILPLLAYCVYYYAIMIKNAPYKFVELKSITLEYGMGNALTNQYDSSTGRYQYLNRQDSLVVITVKLSRDQLLYLHRQAADAGFWNFPNKIEPQTPSSTHLRYHLVFKYQRKTKEIWLDPTDQTKPKLTAAAYKLVQTVKNIIDETEIKLGKD